MANAGITETSEAVEYLKMVVSGLVRDPKKIKIVESVDDMGRLLHLYVDQGDMGIVIGKIGANINALRLLMKIYGFVNGNERISLKIMDLENGRREYRA